MWPVAISCDGFVMEKGFGLSGVCSKLGTEDYYALACQSLACPAILCLCFAHEPPLLNLELGILMPVAVCPDCVRVVYRRGVKWASSWWCCGLSLWGLCHCRPDVQASVIFLVVSLLDQLCLCLYGRQRCSSCLSLQDLQHGEAVWL